MRVLRALLFAAAMGTAHGAFACQLQFTNYEPATEARVLGVLNEPVLLSSEDTTQAERLRIAEAAIRPSPEEPVLLNQNDIVAGETLPQTWEHLDIFPSAVASLDLPLARVVVDDEGIPLLDVDHTGNIEVLAAVAAFENNLALDGFEDR